MVLIFMKVMKAYRKTHKSNSIEVKIIIIIVPSLKRNKYFEIVFCIRKLVLNYSFTFIMCWLIIFCFEKADEKWCIFLIHY
jgi:hypothetical protein